MDNNICRHHYDTLETALQEIEDTLAAAKTHIEALEAKLSALVEAAKDSHCPKCGSAGWVWGYELDEPDNDTATDTMTRYTCDWCRKLKAAIAAAKEVPWVKSCTIPISAGRCGY